MARAEDWPPLKHWRSETTIKVEGKEFRVSLSTRSNTVGVAGQTIDSFLDLLTSEGVKEFYDAVGRAMKRLREKAGRPLGWFWSATAADLEQAIKEDRAELGLPDPAIQTQIDGNTINIRIRP